MNDYKPRVAYWMILPLLLVAVAGAWWRSRASDQVRPRTRPDDSAANQRLQERVQRLERRLQSVEAPRPLEIPLAAAGLSEPPAEPGVAGPVESTQQRGQPEDPALEAEAASAQDRKFMDACEEKFREDGVGTDKSRAREQHIREGFRSFEGSVVEGADCRSTMCRLRVAHSNVDPRHGEMFRRRLQESVPEGMNMWGKTFGDYDIVFLYDADSSPFPSSE